jgi:hypothetical protein
MVSGQGSAGSASRVRSTQKTTTTVLIYTVVGARADETCCLLTADLLLTGGALQVQLPYAFFISSLFHGALVFGPISYQGSNPLDP